MMKIKPVENGFIVYFDNSWIAHSVNSPEYVFNDPEDLAKHVQNWAQIHLEKNN